MAARSSQINGNKLPIIMASYFKRLYPSSLLWKHQITNITMMTNSYLTFNNILSKDYLHASSSFPYLLVMQNMEVIWYCDSSKNQLHKGWQNKNYGIIKKSVSKIKQIQTEWGVCNGTWARVVKSTYWYLTNLHGQHTEFHPIHTQNLPLQLSS